MCRRSFITFVGICLFLFSACEKKTSPVSPPAERTLLVYMVADNTLGSNGYDTDNLDMLLRAVSENDPSPGRIVIYRDPVGETPLLSEIIRNGAGVGEMKTLKAYEEQNSLDPQVMRQVFADVRTLASGLGYGLILWSHATGWLPEESGYTRFSSLRKNAALTELSEPLTRTFGEDGSSQMELSDLAAALPDGMFEYIVIDACFMGEAEVAYALRNKAEYLVASPAEVLANGLPYDQIVSDLLASPVRLSEVCRKFYEYYESLSGTYRTATTALYDLKQMDRLAEVMGRIVESYGTQIPLLDLGGIQHFDRYSRHTMFDLEDVVSKLVPATDPLRSELSAALSSVVLYKRATPSVMGSLFVDTYCGMSVYVPYAGYADLNAHYTRTAWYRRVYGDFSL